MIHTSRALNVKILLVEDSATILLENQEVLIQAGYDVICAEDGQSALRMAREQQPDLFFWI